MKTKVMLIGSAYYAQYRKPLLSGAPLVRLDLELCLIDFLKGAGYEVLYKAHPDRLPEIDGIFEGRAKVIKGYFQNCLNKADIFLFRDIRTSSFLYALCSNKRIVVLDLAFKLTNPFPQAMELLKKRIEIVKTTTDKRNRIIFDEAELLTALSGVIVIV